MNPKELLSEFLSEIINQIKNLKDTDIKKLESGEFTLSLKVIKKKIVKPDIYEPSEEDFEKIKQKLMKAKDREEGYKILSLNLKNKRQLEAFAKSADVFVMKQYKVEEIREKIIEGIVGAILRSNAIQDK